MEFAGRLVRSKSSSVILRRNFRFDMRHRLRNSAPRQAAAGGAGIDSSAMHPIRRREATMPLSAADLEKLGDTPVTIHSTHYPNVHLRMDGTGVTAFAGSGAGKVNCQYGPGQWTSFRVRPQGDGSYAFESLAFPNVFLRMDGAGVPNTMAGGGAVNCQFGAHPYEPSGCVRSRTARSPSSPRRHSRTSICAWSPAAA
ncbi:hypothetical protein [Kitasatospora sp. NPDC001547]|uniref:hypothetical protein n=1 Tax=Kitasatospora sp. NPDC001547 TaxID=3364015 RepID=UPI0036A50A79